MTPERWRQITGIFNGAVAIGDAGARQVYLVEACANDSALRAEVESLLAVHGDATSTFHGPIPGDVLTPSRLTPGTALGRYMVEGLLGAGGMGEVYRARDTRLNRAVALKILPSDVRDNPSLLARFEREAHAIAALKHPYICTLYDVGRDGDIDYLVMELVDGDTLSAHLSRGPLSVAQAIAVTREVAEALAATHAQGIIHRDIKPSNIILTAGGHVKVVDFGLAREAAPVQGNGSTKDDHTEPGIRVGTPYYMSPEQALGQPLDSRTDLFSLGVVLFECLTGERPFDGTTRSDYLRNLLSGPVRSAVALRRDVPSALQTVIARCLERDLSKRLDSASRMAADLGRVAGGHDRFRRRFAAWAALAAVIVLGVGAWLAFRAGITSPTPTSYETAQLRRFTTTPGEEVDSHLSPDGMWMSFITTENAVRRLQVRHIDSAEPRSVTIPDGELSSHLWAPDQSAFACLIWQESVWTVHVVPAYFGGEVPRQSLPLSDVPRNARLVRWSGNAIFLQVEEAGRSLSLRRLDLTSGRFVRVGGPWDEMQVRSFDVSSDGQRVVWAATTAPAGRDDLWVATVDGGASTRITTPDDESRKRYPLWNGDAKVVYQSTRGGQVDLWDLNLARRRAVRISSDSAIEIPESVSSNGSISYRVSAERTALVVWRPLDTTGAQISNDGLSDFAPNAAGDDGSRLTFQRSQPSPVEGFLQMDTDIFVADVQSPIGAPIAPKRVAAGFAPRLSPDGRLLAYLERSRNPPGRVQLMVKNIQANLTVTVSSRLSIPANFGFPVAWIEQTVVWTTAEDLYFVERVEEAGAHVSHYRVGGATTRLAATATPGSITDLYPSSNGRTIAYLARSPSPERDKSLYALHTLDLRSGADHVLHTFGAESAVRLRGWLADDGALAVARALPLDPAQTRSFELLRVPLQGQSTRAGTIANVASLSQMSPRLFELYFTRSVAGIGNLVAFSFATGKERAITANGVRDITFGGATPLGRESVAGIRHEQTTDVYLLDTRPRNTTR